MRIDSINVLGHYDIHLSSWLRAGGRYLYFDVVDYDAAEPTYTVYEITDRSAKREALLKLRSWRHDIGWHWFRFGGTNRDVLNPPRGGLKPGYMERLRKRDGWSPDLTSAFGASKMAIGTTKYPFSEIT